MFASVRFINDEGGEYGGLEFPPSPSRFLQAIVAGTQGNEKYLALLRHLESVTPTIYAVREFVKYEYETYVPKNSWDVQRGQTFEQRQQSSKKHINVRLFPKAEAHVAYEYDVPPNLAISFKEAVEQVGLLGRAMDLVVASVSNTKPKGEFDVYSPSAAGLHGQQVRLNVSVPGFIDSVLKRHLEKVSFAEKSKLKVISKVYLKNPRRVLPRALFDLTNPVPMFRAAHVAAWVRHAAMRTRGDVAEAISGHGKERLSILPIPTLEHGDNRIRRFIVTGESEFLVRAAESALPGLALVGEDDTKVGYIVPAEHDSVFAHYLAPGRTWVSVTPVIMSGYDDRHEEKRKKLLAKMFKHAGLPVPVSVSWFKSGKVAQFKVNASHGHDKYPRVFCAIQFAEKVSGVVAVGTGRHYGLGLFANLRGNSAV